jgi:sulfite exporter TauE/SafE
MTGNDFTPAPLAGKTPDPVKEAFTGTYKAYADQVIGTMRQLHQMAEGRVSTYLLALGGLLMVLSLFWRLKLFGVQFTDLQPVEFITMCIAGILLLVAGAGLRVHQSRVEREVNREIRSVGAQMLEKTQDAQLEMLKAGIKGQGQGGV